MAFVNCVIKFIRRFFNYLHEKFLMTAINSNTVPNLWLILIKFKVIYRAAMIFNYVYDKIVRL